MNAQDVRYSMAMMFAAKGYFGALDMVMDNLHLYLPKSIRGNARRKLINKILLPESRLEVRSSYERASVNVRDIQAKLFSMCGERW